MKWISQEGTLLSVRSKEMSLYLLTVLSSEALLYRQCFQRIGNYMVHIEK